VCRGARIYGIPALYAGAIVTTGAGGALHAHYDQQDLIILQVEGSKRWRIFGPRVLKPIKEPASSVPPETPPILDTVLEPGDLLFLPAGYWHVCDNGPQRSLHLGLFLRRPERRRGD
jgi:ribosomal protein L16 Arg81 hydroxylase